MTAFTAESKIIVVLFTLLGWNPEFILKPFEVEPPLFLRIWPSIAHQIITPDAEPPRDGDMPHGPVDKPVEGGIRLGPWTDLYAGAAACAVLVSDPHGGALLHIIGPFFITVMDHLAAAANGAGGGTLVRICGICRKNPAARNQSVCPRLREDRW